MTQKFYGGHERIIDGRWRVSLPPEFRPLDGADDRHVVGRVPRSACLGLWREEDFDATYERLKEQVRSGGDSQHLLRWFSGHSETVRPDAQSRILVPEKLRSILDVDVEGSDAKVIVIGMGDRIEIWNARLWQNRVGTADSYQDATDDADPWTESRWL